MVMLTVRVTIPASVYPLWEEEVCLLALCLTGLGQRREATSDKATIGWNYTAESYGESSVRSEFVIRRSGMAGELSRSRGGLHCILRVECGPGEDEGERWGLCRSNSRGRRCPLPIVSGGVAGSYPSKGRLLRDVGSLNMTKAGYSHHSFSTAATRRL